ncbi:MerR family transcriptional regulator [Sporolactobacillus kofuensis]|uniref:MerR family transcriptional regulator n=1 Tax=Sporolactobacillus kofuensis TaxID=269672 RepID=A0ABW1WKZ2_9BACL|nr:MerR family transcriptional regulator [Sporolactobacillus kofuensis]MCO7177168.1 MerR family transcriptional regulator [Sporolactobacillus kofuensis]
MRIGEFVKLCQTTKDTVRHYEELTLIQPEKTNAFKNYSQKNVDDFHVIKELQHLGLSLKTIQELFLVKKLNGCGSKVLIDQVCKELFEQDRLLSNEEMKIHEQRNYLSALLSDLKSLNGKT